MTTVLDLALVKAEVEKLANESPDAVYCRPEGGRQCYYDKGNVTNGSVGCIIGQAIKKVNQEIFYTYFTNRVASVGVVLREICTINKQYKDWLSSVQSKQDDGMSWGDAVESVKESHGS